MFVQVQFGLFVQEWMADCCSVLLHGWVFCRLKQQHFTAPRSCCITITVKHPLKHSIDCVQWSLERWIDCSNQIPDRAEEVIGALKRLQMVINRKPLLSYVEHSNGCTGCFTVKVTKTNNI